MRRTMYRVAGESLLVETTDRWAADAIDALFAGWYLTPDSEAAGETDGGTDGGTDAGTDGGADGGADGGPNGIASAPAIVMRGEGGPAPIPADLQAFDVVGGKCYTDGAAAYLDIEGSRVAIGRPGSAAIEVSVDGPLPFDAPALTRVVTYALAAALRQRRRFELHSGGLVDPESGEGVLIIGPSGSGKSTLTVHLASAGWPFLTDDVLLLGAESAEVRAWPLRRCFAITPRTFAASGFLRARTALHDLERDVDHKRRFLPHEVFEGEFIEYCVPGTLVFPQLTDETQSRVSRLSPADTMARLIRMNPWSCYDRSTAPEHLAVLSALARQATAFSLFAGRDLLDPEASVALIAACARE